MYIYRADVYCDLCAGVIMHDLLTASGKRLIDYAHECDYDSDEFPKGPFDAEFEESDTPNHCANCGVFLENPLTTDGYEYVREAVAQDKAEGQLDSIALTIWAPFYDIN